MSILEQVEATLADFRPRNQREFVALQIAKRFDDLHRLPRYLLVAARHDKQTMLEAARTAVLRHELNRTPTAELFFEILAEQEGADQP
jgi:hypothetical protein